MSSANNSIEIQQEIVLGNLRVNSTYYRAVEELDFITYELNTRRLVIPMGTAHQQARRMILVIRTILSIVPDILENQTLYTMVEFMDSIRGDDDVGQ